VVGRQPHAPAAFTPRGIPDTHFLEAELTPGHMVLSVSTRKIPVTDATGTGTARLVAQYLNHCATSGPVFLMYFLVFSAGFRYVCSLELVNGTHVPKLSGEYQEVH